jgi:hypothetical protein
MTPEGFPKGRLQDTTLPAYPILNVDRSRICGRDVLPGQGEPRTRSVVHEQKHMDVESGHSPNMLRSEPPLYIVPAALLSSWPHLQVLASPRRLGQVGCRSLSG